MKINTNTIVEKLKMLTDTRVLGLLCFAVVALLVTWSGLKTVQTNYELEKQISVAKQKNDVETLENQNLKLKNTYYQTNQYLELSARRQFGKAAPGERLYIVPENVALSKVVDLPREKKVEVSVEPQKSKYRKNFDDWMKFLFR